VYSEVVEIVKLSEKEVTKNRRIEADSMHFVASGDCIVTQAPGNDHIKLPEIILKAGSILGHSEVTNKASVQYFGDIRAHLKPVRTYKIFY